MKFNHVVCGGTFDHLHTGHKKLLKACFERGIKVTIGLTSGAMIRHKSYHESIESYVMRCQNVLKFAAESKSSISLIKLNDIYGSTLIDKSIDAIFVTEETLSGAKKINNERKKIGMEPLSIVVVPFAYDDRGDKISSVCIRQGLINREGRVYYKYLISKDVHCMPDSLKRELRKPLGRVIPSIEALSDVQINKMKVSSENRGSISNITVGDVITYNFKKIRITPSLSIIDGVTQRKALNKKFINSILELDYSSAPNKKGTIQREAINALYSLFTLFTPGHSDAIKQLYISGEEDLLTLIVILLSPLKTHVWYGQQEVGAVDVLVTEKKKEIVYNLINRFT